MKELASLIESVEQKINANQQKLYRSYRILHELIVKFRSSVDHAIEAVIDSNPMIYLHPFTV